MNEAAVGLGKVGGVVATPWKGQSSRCLGQLFEQYLHRVVYPPEVLVACQHDLGRLYVRAVIKLVRAVLDQSLGRFPSCLEVVLKGQHTLPVNERLVLAGGTARQMNSSSRQIECVSVPMKRFD